MPDLSDLYIEDLYVEEEEVEAVSPEVKESNEQVFCDREDCYVSNARVILRHRRKMYATAHVASVSAKTVPPRKTGPSWIFMFAMFVVVTSVILLLINIIAPIISVLTLFGGIGMLVGSIIWLILLKPTFVAQITSTSGESDALYSKDRSRIDEFIGAVSDAVVARG
ncbi:MAG: DUF6232 family protein [Chloroflexota bacterium]|nr:DUF6232 family protein [Chloroflexota bacterium]